MAFQVIQVITWTNVIHRQRVYLVQIVDCVRAIRRNENEIPRFLNCFVHFGASKKGVRLEVGVKDVDGKFLG